MSYSTLERRMKGFTLIELLVVVAIIALLISILLPSLADAREQAKRVQCGSDMRSQGQAVNSCWTDNKGYGPTWDDGALANRMLTWIDVLFDTDYLGDTRVGICPKDQRPDEPARDRGTSWGFSFVDRFGVGEPLKPGVRVSYAINAQMHWNNPWDKFEDASRQVFAMEGWWTWFGGINAQWLMFKKLKGFAPPPSNYPHWEGTMVGWRHGRDFLAYVLYVDGSARLLKPKAPNSPQDLLKTVDTVQTFSWLPGEVPHRYDFDPYGPGEITDWASRTPQWFTNPKIISGNQKVPQDYPEYLSANYRTEKKLWRKLPAVDADRQ